MSDNIQAELRAAIERNLPTQIGKVLQKRLEQAESDRQEVSALKAESASLEAALKEERKEVERLKGLLAAHAALDERESAVADRERGIQVTQLEIELAAEKESKEFAKNVALGLVRNIEFRRNRYGQVPLMTEHTDSYGHRSTSASSTYTNVDESESAS